jgi:spore germination protein (amino acid permease)
MAMAINVHVLLIPYVLLTAQRDGWIAVLCAWICVIPIVFVVHRLATQLRQQHLIVWMTRILGRWSLVMRCLIALWLIAIASVSLRDVVHWTHVSFLAMTPLALLGLLFACTCVYATFAGWRVLATVTGILLPIVCIFGFVVALGNLTQKDYSRLLPIGEFGWMPIGEGALYALSGLCEIVLILFALPRTQGTVRLWHWFVFSFLIALLAIGPITGAIATFGPQAAMTQRFPVFEQWRLLQMGRFISHTDFLAIFQWLSGAFVRITLSWLLLLDVIACTTKRQRQISIVAIAVVTAALAGLPLSDITFVQTMQMILPWTSLYVFTIIFILIVCASAAHFFRRRNSKR